MWSSLYHVELTWYAAINPSLLPNYCIASTLFELGWTFCINFSLSLFVVVVIPLPSNQTHGFRLGSCHSFCKLSDLPSFSDNFNLNLVRD